MRLFHSERDGVHVLMTAYAHEANVANRSPLVLLGLSIYTGSSTASLRSTYNALTATGSMTFVDPELYDTPTGPLMHTGDTGLMRQIMVRHDIVDVDGYVPFTGTDVDEFRMLLERGYGPKPTLAKRLLAATPVRPEESVD